jgi:hypothetical protein
MRNLKANAIGLLLDDKKTFLCALLEARKVGMAFASFERRKDVVVNATVVPRKVAVAR